MPIISGLSISLTEAIAKPLMAIYSVNAYSKKIDKNNSKKPENGEEAKPRQAS